MVLYFVIQSIPLLTPLLNLFESTLSTFFRNAFLLYKINCHLNTLCVTQNIISIQINRRISINRFIFNPLDSNLRKYSTYHSNIKTKKGKLSTHLLSSIVMIQKNESVVTFFSVGIQRSFYLPCTILLYCTEIIYPLSRQVNSIV